MDFDLIIRNGTLVDGTGAPRRRTDLGVTDGKVRTIGDLRAKQANRDIDASGKIVAPGVIDVHTHYDAPLHWDPYATSSSWHGTTTVVMANCGFGYAPCRPEHRDRYMWLMVNTEQIPLESQREALNWEWETFPQWMEHLRSLPKGINVATYLPMNALLVYVKGDEVKNRPTTEAEYARMRELLHEAMDAGASGFSLSWLGEGNGHVDYDGSPVPTDVMDPEDAYNLARVLKERGEGIIQALTQLRMESRLELSENLARISGRPVIHNVIIAYEPSDNPTPEEEHLASQWQRTLDWVDRMEGEGLDIYLQSLAFRGWAEIQVEEMTLFNAVPVFEEFSRCKTTEERMKLAQDQAWRRRARENYKYEYFMPVGGGFEQYTLASTYGNPLYESHEGKRLGEVAKIEGKHIVDTFFDILIATNMRVDFKLPAPSSTDGEKTATMLKHPRVIPGTSDGGAHVKMFVGGQYSTDLLNWMVKEEERMTLEEMHSALSLRPAQLFGLRDRGALVEQKAADIVIYDYDEIGFDPFYTVRNDLPGGDWRRTSPAKGISYVIVNGQVILENGEASSVYPGQVLTSGAAS